jgi:hypothetical protein
VVGGKGSGCVTYHCDGGFDGGCDGYDSGACGADGGGGAFACNGGCGGSVPAVGGVDRLNGDGFGGGGTTGDGGCGLGLSPASRGHGAVEFNVGFHGFDGLPGGVDGLSGNISTVQ